MKITLVYFAIFIKNNFYPLKIVVVALKILLLEENPSDIQAIQSFIKEHLPASILFTVNEGTAYLKALKDFKPTIILSNHTLAVISAIEALKISKKESPFTPFIVVTDSVSEEYAAAIIKAGADDYILKNNLARLPGAIEIAVKQKEIEKADLEAAEQLKQSEIRFRNSFDNLLEGVQIIGFDWKFIYVNKAMTKHGRYLKEEFLGCTVMEKYPGIEQTELFKVYQRCFNERVSIQLENEFIFPDKTIGWFELSFQPVPEGIFIMSVDISERKKAAGNLAQGERRFRGLVENNEGIITLVDEQLHTVFRSSSAYRITGWSNEAYAQLHPEELVHADDVEKMKKVYQQTLAAPGKPQPISMRIKHKDGHYIWLEGMLNNLFHEPAINGMVSNLRDVTKRKNAEAILIKEIDKFAKIAATSPGLIYSMRQNRDGLSYPYASNALEDIYGVVYEDIESDATKIFELIHPADVDMMMKKVQETKSKLVPLQGEYRYLHPTKGEVWHEVNSLPVVEPEGTVICHGIVTDITLRKKAEQKLDEERDKFAKISATAPGLIYSFSLLKDGTFTFPYASNAIEDIFGFRHDEIRDDASGLFKFGHPDDVDRLFKSVAESAATNSHWKEEFRYLHPKKGEISLAGHSIPLTETDGTVTWHGIITDITERKTAEKKLIKVNRLYTFISQINQMIVRTTDETTLFKEACNIAVECGKFKKVRIKMIDPLTSKIFTVMEAGELLDSIIKSKAIETAGDANEAGPSAMAINQGKMIICNDFEKDALMQPWKSSALRNGYLSSTAIPIKKFGKIVGAFTFYSGEKNFFDTEEVILLEKTANDVSFALEIIENDVLRKKSEQAVLETEKRYQTLTEVSPVGIFHTDVNGSTTYVNPFWCQLSGLSFAEALGNNWLNAVHKDDRETLLSGWQNATSIQELSLSEYRFVHRDGSITWVLGQAIPEKNAAGEIVGYIGTVTDISKHIIAEKKSSEDNAFIESVNNASPDFIYIYDIIEQKYIYKNEGIQAILGYSKQEVEKMGNRIFTLLMHPDDHDYYEKVTEPSYQAAKDKEVILSEFRVVDKKGNWHWLSSKDSVFVRAADGSPKQIFSVISDITESKQTDNDLRKNKESLELAEELAKLGNWEFHINTQTSNWSKQMFRHFGFAPADSTPSFDEFIVRLHPEDQHKFIAGFKTMALGIEPSINILRTNPSVLPLRYFEPTYYISKDNNGIPLKFSGTMLDVTERILYEKKLVESEEKYRTLIDQASDGIFIADAGGKFNIVNKSACKMSGYTEKELVNLTIYDLVHPESLVNQPFLFKEMEQPEGAQSERKMVRKDKSMLDIEISAKFLYDGRFIAFIRDINLRKKSEETINLTNERYNLVAKATNDSIWDFNILTGEITRTGDGFKNLFGYDPLPENHDHLHWTKLVHAEDLKRVQQSQAEVLNNPLQNYWEQEYRFRKLDGRYAVVYDRGYIIRDKAGNAVRMIGATQDITKMKENELNLSNLNKSLKVQSEKLAESNTELEQFAYVASHDLQEPLRMVTSFLKLLEKKYGETLDASGKKCIHFAVDGANRMRQIILDLLDYSRVGRTNGEKQAINLNTLVNEINKLFRKEIEEKKASILIQELPEIHGHEAPVRQVFQNLISNALKYSRQNIPTRIEIQAIDLKDHWQFSVADNGIGISNEYFDKVFILFQRLHSKEEFSGTGIGLAVTKKIIENMGGRIWITSEEDKGSTFHFTIEKK